MKLGSIESYFARQIILEKLNYIEVIKRYPQYKEGIDKLLIEQNKSHLIVEIID